MLRSVLEQLFAGRRATAREAATPATPGQKTPPQQAFTYRADGLATIHNADFLADQRFREAYRAGAHSGHRICTPGDLHIEWRVYVCCWAGQHAMRLDGDFVECGVSTGIVSIAVTRYLEFNRSSKKFYLFDTFSGIPEEQMATEEVALGTSKNRRHYFDCYQSVCESFRDYPNVSIVKGKVPDSLSGVEIDRVAYLHIDMNIAYPEVAASEYFWDRMVPGGIIIYDDYASLAHVPQKTALDAFARERGVSILSLPTGQGLLIKS